MKRGAKLLLFLLIFFSLSFLNATDYYVDKTSGSDSAAGTSSGTAWKTIGKVSSESFNPGDNIYFKRGETWREQLNASGSGSSGNPITYGAYGSGDKPVISGADLIISWEESSSGSGWNESFEDVKGNWDLTISENGNVFSRDNTQVNEGSYSALAESDTGNTGWNRLYKSITTGTEFTVELDVYIDDTTNNLRVLELYDGATEVGYIQLESDEDAGMNFRDNSGYLGYYAATNGVTFDSWHNIKVEVKEDASDGYYKIYIDDSLVKSYTSVTNNNYDVDTLRIFSAFQAGSHNYNVYMDDARFYENSSSADIWSSSLTKEPNIVFFDDFRGTEEISCPSGLDSENEWCWDSNSLYVYSDSDPNTAFTNPGIEASQRNRGVSIVLENYIKVEDLRIEKVRANGVVSDTTLGTIIEDLEFGLAPYKAPAPGVINFYSADSSVIRNCVIESGYDSQAIYVGDTENFLMEGCNISAGTGSSGADNGIQMINVDNVTVQNNYIDMTGHGGEKGCISTNEDGGTTQNVLIQNNRLIDGNWGIAPSGDNIVVRYNFISDTGESTSDLWASGIWISGVDSDNVDIYYNVIENARSGIHAWNSERTDHNIYGNTIYGSERFDFIIDSEIDGSFKNNILWSPDASENAYRVDGIVGGGSFDSDYNIIDETAGFTYLGSSYSTFSSFQSAASQDSNSLTLNPLFTDVGDGDFTLQSSSPAINTGENLGLDYGEGLYSDSSWPDDVFVLGQDNHGSEWEIGAYVYEETSGVGSSDVEGGGGPVRVGTQNSESSELEESDSIESEEEVSGQELEGATKSLSVKTVAIIGVIVLIIVIGVIIGVVIRNRNETQMTFGKNTSAEN